MKVKLYTMQALAEHLDTTYGYIRQLMLKVKRGEIETWRDFRFISIGEGKRSTWLAYPKNLKIEVVTSDTE